MGELENNACWDVDGNTIERLSDDIFINILKRLDSPRDVAHAACVSSSWNKNVLEGNLWRVLCIKSFPEVERFEWVDNGTSEIRNDNVGASSESFVLRKREKESSTYKYLLRELLLPPIEESCISKPLHASSTDNYPRESIAETLYPNPINRDEVTPSYWSSRGHSSVEAPETLTYLLSTKLCVIHKIKIQPFEAFFQEGIPIYSAKSVRFRFGYFGSPTCQDTFDGLSLACDKTNFDDYVWTYVSPEFPMKQESSLQSFKLPRPVLCIGGILRIELLGRVQNQAEDGLYYICVSHVHVCGRPLWGFNFELIAHQKNLGLRCLWNNNRYDRDGNYMSTGSHEGSSIGSPGLIAESLRWLQPWNGSIISILLDNFGMPGVPVRIGNESDDDDEHDEIQPF